MKFRPNAKLDPSQVRDTRAYSKAVVLASFAMRPRLPIPPPRRLPPLPPNTGGVPKRPRKANKPVVLGQILGKKYAR